MKRYAVAVAMLALVGLVLAGCGGGNKPPTASISAPGDNAQLKDLTVQFAGQGQDPENKGLSYAWDFGDGQTGSGASASHAYAQGGKYTVKLTVTDDAGQQATDTVTVAVNDPPRAVAAVKAEEASGVAMKFAAGPAPLRLEFDASKSSDSDGQIDGYAWDFGDGQTGEGVKPEHTFTQPGEYTVTLTVSDDAGATAQDEVQVTVQEAPAAVPTPSQGAVVTVKLITDGSKNYFEPAFVRIQPGDTVRWVNESGVHTTTSYSADNQRANGIPAEAAGWDSGLLTEAGATFEHTFTQPGTYAYFCLPHEALGMVGVVMVGEGEPSSSQDFLNGLPEAARQTFAEQLGLGSGGQVVTVQMTGENGEYDFQPGAVKVRPGDTVRWVNVSGYPHTVTSYDPDHYGKAQGIPQGAPGFDSGMLMNEGDTFTWTVPADAQPGSYAYFCLPHEALGMVGIIVVDHYTPVSEEFISTLPSEKAKDEMKEYMEQAAEL